jgi:hypothetical protein
MYGHGTQYKRKKDQAIAASLTERTIPDAARVVGISTRTLKRWMEDPEFEKELLAARLERYLQTTGRLEQHSYAASNVLLKNMADPKTPPSVQIKAALSVLKLTSEAIEAIKERALEQRISELERAAKDTKGQGQGDRHNDDEGE